MAEFSTEKMFDDIIKIILEAEQCDLEDDRLKCYENVLEYINTIKTTSFELGYLSALEMEDEINNI
jgi:hypothetical protein